MKKIKIFVLLCLVPYFVNSQNYYKNTPEVYYNMDTVGNTLKDTLHLPVMKVINPKLLSKIEKCVKNYEKKIISTPDSLGSYFSLTILFKIEDTSLYIDPIANFYLSNDYDNHNLNNKFRPKYQLLYYGSFYFNNYLFMIRSANDVDVNFLQRFFTTTDKYIDIKIYKSPYFRDITKDIESYYFMSFKYKIKTNKKGKIQFESK
jgi:hypothetical protein